MEQYLPFALADPVFYETPQRWTTTGRGPFAAVDRALPDGWSRRTRSVWTLLTPNGGPGPSQGWKIHVSATSQEAERVVDTVWDYCVERHIGFKFLSSPDLHWIYNSKFAPRAASGKLVAIYPEDEEQLETVLDELSRLLGGTEGPYILSDLRWREGPLFVRYGGFKDMWCIDASGDLVPAIEKPDGTLVPDRRKPGFSVPPWVEVPDFIQDQLAARQGHELGYDVLRSLHFSNAGGVYLARRRTDGAEVVLKEARPHTGLDRAGQDAVARLQHERGVLEQLAGVPGVPGVHDYFIAGGHHMLAMQYMKGDSIWKWIARRHPLLDLEYTEAEVKEFTERALAVVANAAKLVEQVHARGIVLGDLHPGNLLVAEEDDSVALVDFEAAGQIADSGYRPVMRAHGFASWDSGRTGADVDRYALAALRLWVFMPMNLMWELDPARIAENIDEIEERFDLPEDYCADLRRELLPAPRTGTPAEVISGGRPLDVRLDVEHPDVDAAIASLTAGILHSATPDREDRLFPGDVDQFRYDGTGFAFGAAGVLWALSVAGVQPPAEHQVWLVEAATRMRPDPGFCTGLHGVAHVLDHLGHQDLAVSLVDKARPLTERLSHPGYFTGLSGIGLNYLHFARRTGEQHYFDEAVRIGERLAALVKDGELDKADAGLLHGWTGAALFALRMYEVTGDPADLDRAVAALHRDLDRCVTLPNGSLQVRDWKTRRRAIAYLDGGSGGIGVVAKQLLAHREDGRISESVPKIAHGLRPEYVVETTLFNGRAGFIAMLCALTGATDDAIPRHVRRLQWHALSYHGRLAFPGKASLRLSMDLATGSAGVALALNKIRRPRADFLPFLERGGEPDGPSQVPA